LLFYFDETEKIKPNVQPHYEAHTLIWW